MRLEGLNPDCFLNLFVVVDHLGEQPNQLGVVELMALVDTFMHIVSLGEGHSELVSKVTLSIRLEKKVVMAS